MEEIKACSRRNPHTPHGTCLGTAPEFPWEQIEQVADEDRSEPMHGNCEQCGRLYYGICYPCDIDPPR